MNSFLFKIISLLILALLHANVSAKEIELLKAERIAEDVDFPVALCYFDKDTILFTEKGGYIKIIKNGRLQKEPLKKLDVTTGFERGLLGIACREKKVYVYYTYTKSLKTYNRVVSLFPEKIIIDKIPGAIIHNGGILAFAKKAPFIYLLEMQMIKIYHRR